MRRRGIGWLRAVCGVAVAVGTLGLGVAPASATPGTISTIAGGLGAGPAITVGQNPAALAASGSYLWVADGRFDGFVVRRLDTTTGVETPVVTLSNDAVDPSYSDPTIAADRAGDVYVSSFSAAQGWHVTELLPSGKTKVVAGGGTLSHVDGVAATMEQLNTIEGLATDTAGNLYLSENTWQDGSNGFRSETDARVRKVGRDGKITTVAGIGPSTAVLGDGGPARLASLSEPRALATDGAGNLYIADYGDQRVRRVDSKLGLITTVAGGGTSTADGVPAVSAAIWPDAIAVDGSRLLIGDTVHYRLRAVTGSTITTVAGNGSSDYSGKGGDGGPATAAAVTPDELAVSPAGIFLGQFTLPGDAHVIRLVDRTGTIHHYAGTGWQYYGGDGGPAAEAQFSSMGDVAADRAGNLYVTDDNVSTIDRRVRKIDASGTMTTVAGTGVYAGNQGAGDGGPATAATFGAIDHIAVGPDGDLYIEDFWAGKIRRVDANGIISTFANGNGGIGFDQAGDLIVADGCIVQRVDPDGVPTTIAGTTPCQQTDSGDGGAATAAKFGIIHDLAVDAADNIYVAETSIQGGYVDRVRRIDPTGTVTTVAGGGTGGDGGPATAASIEATGIGLDAQGNLLIVSRSQGRVHQVGSDGILRTIVGGGTGGDGGPATAALLRWPTNVALDTAGNLLITAADRNGNLNAGVIRKVSAA